MESQRKIEREYNQLLKQVEKDPYYKTDLTNRVNCYVCQSCGHITKTKDVDPGVTPFMFRCEKCKGVAYSSFFKDVAPNQSPTFEWYRPSLKEVLKMRKNPFSDLEHILKGGLSYRKITNQ